MIVGQLEIELAANIARLSSDMKKAQGVVDQATGAMARAAGLARMALGAIAGVLSIGAFAGFIKGAADASAGLHDMSIQTGASVASLKAFQAVAATTDTTIDDIGGAMNRFAKGMASADEESKGIGRAVQSIGLDFNALKAMAPEQQMLAIARALDRFENGAFKASVAMTFYGREGAAMLPYLGDLAAQSGEVTAMLTAQEIATQKASAALADDFGDNLAKITKLGNDWARDLSNGMMPALVAVTGEILRAAESTSGFAAAIRQATADGTVATWTVNFIDGIKKIIAAIEPAAKIAAAYFTIFVAAPAVYAAVGSAVWKVVAALSTYAMNVAIGQASTVSFNTVLFGTSVAAQLAAGSLTKMALAGNVLFAAFSGWQIGKYLEEQSTKVQVFAEVLTGAVLEMWEHIKLGTKLALDAITVLWRSAFSGLTSSLSTVYGGIASGLSRLGFEEKGAQVKEFADRVRQAGEAQGTFASRTAEARAEHGRNITAIRMVTQSHVSAIKVADQVSEATRGTGAASASAAKAATAAAAATAQNAKAAAEMSRAIKEAADFEERYTSALGMTAGILADRVKDAEAEATRNEELARTYGMSKAAIEAEELARLENQLAQKTSLGLSEQEIETLEKLIVAKKRNAAAVGAMEQVDAAKKAQEDWKRAADSIEQSLTDALLRGFESGKSFGRNLIDTLKNMFSTLVLRPTIQGVMAPVAGGLGMFGASGAASAAGTGGGASGVGSMVGSGLGIGGTLASIGTGAMQTAGAWLTGQIGFGSTLSAGIGAIGTGTASGIMAGLSSVVGVLGPIALGIGAAVAIWKKLDTSGTYHTGGASSASAAGVTTIAAESLNFERTRTSKEVESLTAQLAQGVVGILDSTAKAFGKEVGYSAATAFADDTSKDGAWGGLRILLGSQKVLDWQDTKTGSWAPKTFADGEKGRAEYLVALSSSVRTALDGIGLPSWAQKMLDSLGAGAGLEEMAKVVETINQTESALKAMRTELVGFAGLSDGAVSALMTAAGGIQALTGGASAFYDNFYTDAEKSAAATKQVTDALAAVGLQMPATRDEFRALVESQMRLGEAGAPAAATLLGVSQAFAQLVPVIEATAAAGRSAADILSEKNGLQDQLNQLTMAPGDYAKSKLDPSNHGLYDQVQSAQAQKDATEKLLAANQGYLDQIHEIERGSMTLQQLRADDIKGMDASTIALYDLLAAKTQERDAMAAVTAANQAWQDKIDEFNKSQMTATELRAVETRGMDASTVALYDRYHALLANKAADEASAKAYGEMQERQNAAWEKSRADGIAAADKAAADEKSLATRRAGMDLELFNLTHTAVEQLAHARELELAAIDPTLLGLQQQIHAAQDRAKAEAEAAAKAESVAQERIGLERELLQLQGDTAALRALDLAKIDPANRSLKEHIWAMQDQAEAAKAAAQAIAQTGDIDQMMRQAQADIITNAQKAWQGIGKSLIEEVNRIRGVMQASSVIDLADAQAKFSTASAQARAGDYSAAQMLPEMSRALLDMAEQEAATSQELALIRAATVASLQATAGIANSTNFRSAEQATNWVRPAAMPSSGAALDNSNALLAELKAMREELTVIKESSRKHADMYEQQTEGGNAARVVIVDE